MTIFNLLDQAAQNISALQSNQNAELVVWPAGGGGEHTERSDISTGGEGLPGPGSPPAPLFASFLPTWTQQYRQQDGRRSGWLSSNLLSLIGWLVFQECWIGELCCCFFKVRGKGKEWGNNCIKIWHLTVTNHLVQGPDWGNSGYDIIMKFGDISLC